MNETSTSTPNNYQRGAIFQNEESYKRWLEFHLAEDANFDPSTYYIQITNTK